MTLHTATSEQKALLPSVSVFVSANAGAGKTSLLTNRVVSLLLHGVNPSQILCLTFTNAAAAEMKTRVLKVLGQWVMAKDDLLKDTLKGVLGHTPDDRLVKRARTLFAEVLEAPEGIRIQTIHGFCQSLLRRFPIEAGITPQFRIIEPRTEQELLAEAQIQLFTRAQTGSGVLRNAIAYLASTAGESRIDLLLKEMIQNKRKFLSLFDKVRDVDHAVAMIWESLAINRNCSVSELIAEHFKYDDKTITTLRAIANLTLQSPAKTDQQTGRGLAEWFEKPHLQETLLESYLNVFLTAKYTPRTTLFTKKTLPDADLITSLLAEQERVEKFYEQLSSLKVAKLSECMLITANQLLVFYGELKRVRAALDYDDLVLGASALLNRKAIAPWILFKLDGGIDHILVDEAQDTSPEQWQIIEALTQEFFAGNGRKDTDRSLFIVGDEKQSIYSFQGADVAALGKMQHYFTARIKDAAKEVQTLTLTRSFRSTPEVLTAVDAIFASPAARNGLMFSDGELAHIPTRSSHKGLVEVWPVIQADEDSPISHGTLLARHIAETISGWFTGGMQLESKTRAVEPGDIMILVRNRTSLVDKLVRTLKRKNIPVAGIDRMKLGDNLAVKDLIALAQFLLLPEDDLTLAALLKSPMFNLAEEQLFDLSWQRGRQSLWDSMRSLAEQEEHFADIVNQLTDWRAKVDFVSPFELYSYVLDCCGARKKILGRMGQEYDDPIDEFLVQTLAYEQSHTASMQGFLHWINASESVIKRDMEQVKNAVRIMTVHAAKGLQAPIVILPDTTELPTQKERLLWHHDNNVAMPLLPPSSDKDDDLCRSIRNTQREAMLAEYRRQLYVALTRAEDMLFICGASGKENVNPQSWYALISDGLQPIATTIEMKHGNGLRLGSVPEQSSGKPANVKTDSNKIPYDFSFIHNPPPVEQSPTKPLSPSRLQDNAPASSSPLKSAFIFERGKLVHELLQYLPNTEPQTRDALAQYIAKSYPSMSEDVRNHCIENAISIIGKKEYAFLFQRGSLAEAPVAGNVEIYGKIISVAGQIDRLAIINDTVWVVEYKSNILPPKSAETVPKVYLRQLLLYQKLLAEIYMGKTIRCAILWTSVPEFMPIDNALLDEGLLSSYI